MSTATSPTIMLLVISVHSKVTLEAHPLSSLITEGGWGRRMTGYRFSNIGNSGGKHSPYVLRNGSSSSGRVSMPLCPKGPGG